MLQPIMLIDDDVDDCDLFESACIEAGIENPVIKFTRSTDALDYLAVMILQPFFIMCDVNMPAINGLRLRQKIDSDDKLRLKAIPFLMWSTGESGFLIRQAFSLNIQGFFKKPNSQKELIVIVSAISNYWKISMKP